MRTRTQTDGYPSNYFVTDSFSTNDMLRVSAEETGRALKAVSLKEKGLHEDDLREWVIDSPQEIFREDYLLIGREVSVKHVGDAIDLLAVDRDGNVVAIELKRGALKPGVDFQGLKYAAYISHWATRSSETSSRSPNRRGGGKRSTRTTRRSQRHSTTSVTKTTP